MDHILSERSTLTHLSWVALHGMAHSFIESDKAVIHVICLVTSVVVVFILSGCDILVVHLDADPVMVLLLFLLDHT